MPARPFSRCGRFAEEYSSLGEVKTPTEAEAAAQALTPIRPVVFVTSNSVATMDAIGTISGEVVIMTFGVREFGLGYAM